MGGKDAVCWRLLICQAYHLSSLSGADAEKDYFHARASEIRAVEERVKGKS